jgi:hypothetical protein
MCARIDSTMRVKSGSSGSIAPGAMCQSSAVHEVSSASGQSNASSNTANAARTPSGACTCSPATNAASNADAASYATQPMHQWPARASACAASSVGATSCASRATSHRSGAPKRRRRRGDAASAGRSGRSMSVSGIGVVTGGAALVQSGRIPGREGLFTLRKPDALPARTLRARREPQPG